MSDSVTVTVSYGSEKHKLQISAQGDAAEPTLQDMAVIIEQITGVPITFQKLIYKGKSLKEMDKPLSALGIKNGCKVMLIGKRNSPEEDAELRKLKDLERSVELVANKLEEISKEFTGLQKGFLAKNLQTEALGKLDKRIKSAVEQFMKLLEQIDSVSVPDNFNDCRLKRKNLVKKVQGLLAQCDTVEGNIGQEMDKLQSKNMALSE
ncbi:BAG family molecular chaperone regulator 1 isoform X1 [Ambystoma mexicanum]|uniref:BAG family molecular chaperone regulator 1 isoform X1 n=1 Tax=Ambystoma mexicanum TaxID=8296 RepID=UPI0037E88586